MMTILETIRGLPDSPGVYQYFDTNGRLLYIGKAKSLKNRVKSYWKFTPELHPDPTQGSRISKMLHETTKLEYLLTPSEEDALILENSLIKQLKPRYNILLRDDKTYPYIYIDLSQDFPRFELTRKVIKGNKIKYYGPFPSGGRALLDAIYEIYPLVQKQSGLTGGKSCLFHQIGKCPAPCESKITKEEYHKTIFLAIKAIQKRSIIIDNLKERMTLLAQKERFEEAAKTRDRIEAIEALKIHSDIDLANNENIDIFAIHTNETRGVVVRMFLRLGRIISASHTFFRRTDVYDADEAYRQALLDLYDTETPTAPSVIIVADPIMDDGLSATLSKKIGKNISVHYPEKGPKKRLANLAMTNAVELLKQNRSTETPIEQKIAELFELALPPYRLEVFDNSHMMGSATVGGMVVWDEGNWDKKSYRHYKLEAKDEYGQMREMLSRRIKDFHSTPPPDLWLLDGGETLRRLATALLSETNVNLEVIAIAKEKLDAKAYRAKGAARDLLYSELGVMSLKTSDKRLQWLQRLRDEAHRFAVTYHQKHKRKQDTRIALLEKRGIGSATIKKLLNHFGTFESIDRADKEELALVVNKKIVDIISNQ